MSKKGSSKKQTDKGESGFYSYFEMKWGERWENLRKAMLQAPDYTEISKGLTKSYFLDSASLVPPSILGVRPGMRVLDMCAAPGGKSLQLALSLQGKGEFIANDLSSKRRTRLKQVLQEHLPPELQHNIRITGHDASKWGLYQKDYYDRILLDAPCSSERHLLCNPVYLGEWSPSRIKSLSRRQYALLCAAFDCLKPGGRLVYSTCALSQEENEGVIAKLQKKRKGVKPIKPAEAPSGEALQIGYHILPDRGGAGPIYYCLIEKTL